MNNTFASRGISSGGAIPKSKIPLQSELSFEDDFNPTSYKFGNKVSNNKPEQIIGPIGTPTALRTEQAITSNNSSQSIRHPGSPLMCYVVRLKHGDELRKSLLAYAKKNGLKAAFVMSCVGSSTSSRIRLASATPENEANYMLDIVNPTEIISLSGTLSGGGHLHIGLSDSAGKMMGGHLLESYIDTTAEVVIGDCSALSFSRDFDDNTGFHELRVTER